MTQTTELHGQAMQMMEMPLGTIMGAMNWAEMGFCLLAAGDLDGQRVWLRVIEAIKLLSGTETPADAEVH